MTYVGISLLLVLVFLITKRERERKKITLVIKKKKGIKKNDIYFFLRHLSTIVFLSFAIRGVC